MVNAPGESSSTDSGITGGGKGDNKVYIKGIPHHKIATDSMIEHIVQLIEEKVSEQ